MKNLLHSSLVVASIVASQSASAARAPEAEPLSAATPMSSIEDRHLEALLYDEELSAPRRQMRDEESVHGRRKTTKSGKVHRAAHRSDERTAYKGA